MLHSPLSFYACRTPDIIARISEPSEIIGSGAKNPYNDFWYNDFGRLARRPKGIYANVHPARSVFLYFSLYFGSKNKADCASMV